MIIATAAEMQKDFGKYLNLVMSGQEVVVTQDGREVGRFVPKGAVTSNITDSLVGILKKECDLDAVREKALLEKYVTNIRR